MAAGITDRIYQGLVKWTPGRLTTVTELAFYRTRGLNKRGEAVPLYMRIFNQQRQHNSSCLEIAATCLAVKLVVNTITEGHHRFFRR